LLPIEPEIKPFVLTPVDIIPAGFLPRIPGIQEDTTIHSPQFVQKKPEITYRVKPEYPAIALLTGQEGLVILSAVIGKDGAIERIGILKSNRFFDRAAIEALKQYTFTPAIQNDQPVRVEMSIPFRFDIK
jgi:TonB family protein